MSKLDYFYKTKFVKMGRWGGLLPLDCHPWHDEVNSRYFKKYFGFHKGTLILFDHDAATASCYFPVDFIRKFYKFIDASTSKNNKSIEKLLLRFYPMREEARKQLQTNALKNYKELSSVQLIKAYKTNRDWAHKITTYDQFGWIGEEYWPIKMEKILNKYGLGSQSPEFFKVLFALTKPEEISTTLTEKRAVIEQIIKIKNKKSSIEGSAKYLAKKFGWMPVFAFGVPWNEKHYEEELLTLSKTPLKELEKQYKVLKEYKQIRNSEIREVVTKYKISENDLQLFIDFGLALDARNEAEYILSLSGFFVLPIYKEICRRLSVSVAQLRILSEKEVIAALQNKLYAEKRIYEKGKFSGWGFGADMKKQINFSSDETAKLLKYLDSNVKNLQGNIEGRGVCASPGKVKGVAKIVTSPDKSHKVNQGDILITEATTVDYLSAMKLAAAFVTEVGGLTCHAAVVAREFGVPCVVGYKDATKKFKDGEKIEVVADQGIVRKVK